MAQAEDLRNLDGNPRHLPAVWERVEREMLRFPRGSITSLSGGPFNFLDPASWQFNLIDTIHSLSQINRFVGHSDRPYSVLQHSLWCSKHVKDFIPADIKSLASHRWLARLSLEALTHDFAEAELGDVSSPLKSIPAMGFYQKLEDKVLEAKLRQFGVWYDDHDSLRSELVELIDRVAFLTETRDLRGGEDCDILPRSTIIPLPAHVVRGRFTDTYNVLKAVAG